ncbi:hypothetical protein ACFLV4_05860 [Chloroflexota bacterium]
MPDNIDMHRIRQVILETVERQSPGGNLQTASVLHAALDTLGWQRNIQIEQAMLTIWHDLFRTGYLAWGLNFTNANPPHCHVTEQGRRTLQNLTRDPANPAGYLAHLMAVTTLNPIAQSYLDEALKTYNTDSYKAAAVMIGAAAESMTLELRDALLQRIEHFNLIPSRDLKDWRLKRILDAISKELNSHRNQMSVEMAESVEQYWPAFTGQIRKVRNDAGHPTSIQPVTHETVQASLLIFPELATLIKNLMTWVSSDYS